MVRPDQPRLPSRLDVLLAGVATVFVVVGTVVVAGAGQAQSRPLDAGAFVLVVLTAGALAWRRVAAVSVLSVVVVLVAGYLLLGYPFGPIQLCLVVAMFEVGRVRGIRTSALACAGAAALSALGILFRSLVPAAMPLLLLAVWVSWLVVPWSVGALVQVRTEAVRRSRRELVARAALEERMRVAAEVHDIAGHGLAAVAMQAGVALVVFDEQLAQARTSLEAIRSTSVRALSELRGVLDDSAVPSGAGGHLTPGLGEVATLVDGVRAAGLPIELTVDTGTVADEVPAAVGRVAYRVVQEALTNVLRHAGPTTARVCVHRAGDVLVVEVLDAGLGAGEVQPGLGLAGMRERVTAAGGELVAGPTPGGGFRVRACLPLAGAAR